MSTSTKKGAAAAVAAAAVIIGAGTTGAILGAQNEATADLPGVPQAYAPFVAAGAETCEAIDAPTLAAVLETSSRFDTELTGGAGQEGPAQFMPATWEVMGAEVDEDGQVADVPGTGDPRDPGDATMALARLLCVIDEHQAPAREAGDIAGDRRELILAAHLAGEQAVLDAGGVPEFPETQQGVDSIMATAHEYEAGAR